MANVENRSKFLSHFNAWLVPCAFALCLCFGQIASGDAASNGQAVQKVSQEQFERSQQGFIDKGNKISANEAKLKKIQDTPEEQRSDGDKAAMTTLPDENKSLLAGMKEDKANMDAFNTAGASGQKLTETATDGQGGQRGAAAPAPAGNSGEKEKSAAPILLGSPSGGSSSSQSATNSSTSSPTSSSSSSTADTSFSIPSTAATSSDPGITNLANNGGGTNSSAASDGTNSSGPSQTDQIVSSIQMAAASQADSLIKQQATATTAGGTTTSPASDSLAVQVAGTTGGGSTTQGTPSGGTTGTTIADQLRNFGGSGGLGAGTAPTSVAAATNGSTLGGSATDQTGIGGGRDVSVASTTPISQSFNSGTGSSSLATPRTSSGIPSGAIGIGVPAQSTLRGVASSAVSSIAARIGRLTSGVSNLSSTNSATTSQSSARGIGVVGGSTRSTLRSASH